MLVHDLLKKTVVSLFRSKNKAIIREAEFILRDLGIRGNEITAFVRVIEKEVNKADFEGEEVETILMRLRFLGTEFLDFINNFG